MMKVVWVTRLRRRSTRSSSGLCSRRSAAGESDPGGSDPDAGGVGQIYVDPAIVDYAVRLVAATRSPGGVGLSDLDRSDLWGEPAGHDRARPGGRALAFLRGRDYGCPMTSTKWHSTCCGTGLCCRTRRWPTDSMPTASSSAYCAPYLCRTWCCSHDLRARPVAPHAGVAGRRRLDGRIQGGTARRGGECFEPRRVAAVRRRRRPRHIDWNVTARLDGPQVREFNEDRELTTGWSRPIGIPGGCGPGRGKHDVLAELARSSWPGCWDERQPGRCCPL